MNEQELSKLLHEAAEDVTVPPTASSRVLRRARLRMATTGALMLSVVVLIAGGGFALATRSTEAQPKVLESARSPIVTAPDAPESDLVLMGDGEILLAEVQESDDQTWTFLGIEQKSRLCLSSTTHRAKGSPGTGDCAPLGVPGNRHLGFYMWDSGKNERLEVLGMLSTDVARLELQGSNASDDVVMIIRSPGRLGNERNFFFLWLPPDEVGTLVAYDDAGNVLQESELCFEPGVRGVSCTVGTLPDSLGTGPPLIPADVSMACGEITPGKVGRLLGEPTPQQTMQRWIDSLDLDLTPDEFEVERMDSDTLAMSLPGPKDRDAVFAMLSKKGDHQWSIVELLYCEGIVDPPRGRLPKDLPPPPNPPTMQPPPPPSPSP